MLVHGASVSGLEAGVACSSQEKWAGVNEEEAVETLYSGSTRMLLETHKQEVSLEYHLEACRTSQGTDGGLRKSLFL